VSDCSDKLNSLSHIRRRASIRHGKQSNPTATPAIPEHQTKVTMTATLHKPQISGFGTSMLQRIGNTPLIRLDRLTEHLPGVQLYGKAEWLNPGGSVKDRAASNIVRDAMERGQLGPGSARGNGDRTLLDATSGNTGIAYAMLGAALGFRVQLCMPSNVSVERKRILAAYGAEVVWTDPSDGSDGAIRKVKELASADPDRYFYADQYGNDNNWLAHYNTTGPEIWKQTEGTVTHFVSALGTSGTFMGTTRRLREFNPEIQCISMQPDSPFNGLEGLKHMATAIVPPIYDPNLADRNIDMATERAYAMAKWLGRNQGLLIGVSAAAAVAAALEVAEGEAAAGREAVVVTILCDSADKYLSERFWADPIAADIALHAKLGGR
jgi:cysteine synthase B